MTNHQPDNPHPDNPHPDPRPDLAPEDRPDQGSGNGASVPTGSDAEVTDAEARRLWRLLDAAPAEDADCPSLMTLAAFVDDRVTASERRSIQIHLEACGPCAGAIESVREAQDDAGVMVVVPDAIRDRARALVTGAAPTVSPRRHADRRRPERHAPWQRVVRWSAMAAALLVTCSIGYRTGLRSAPAPEHDLATAMTFGLLEADETNDFEMIFAIDELDSAEVGGEVGS